MTDKHCLALNQNSMLLYQPQEHATESTTQTLSNRAAGLKEKSLHTDVTKSEHPQLAH